MNAGQSEYSYFGRRPQSRMIKSSSFQNITTRLIARESICEQLCKNDAIFTYIYSLPTEKDIYDCRTVSILSFRVFICTFHPEISSFFGNSFLYLFLFCVIHTSVLFLFTWFPSLFNLEKEKENCNLVSKVNIN